jgi:hypothetical protein
LFSWKFCDKIGFSIHINKLRTSLKIAQETHRKIAWIIHQIFKKKSCKEKLPQHTLFLQTNFPFIFLFLAFFLQIFEFSSIISSKCLGMRVCPCKEWKKGQIFFFFRLKMWKSFSLYCFGLCVNWTTRKKKWRKIYYHYS